LAPAFLAGLVEGQRVKLVAGDVALVVPGGRHYAGANLASAPPTRSGNRTTSWLRAGACPQPGCGGPEPGQNGRVLQMRPARSSDKAAVARVVDSRCGWMEARELPSWRGARDDLVAQCDNPEGDVLTGRTDVGRHGLLRRLGSYQSRPGQPSGSSKNSRGVISGASYWICLRVRSGRACRSRGKRLLTGWSAPG
jgi:hypothetical protein